ncbi:MAG TPA: Hsp20/alpha crystallin family protein [Bacteroidales bacterium]|nr:Hsp20/alpha crystallin family protein [Bacteroidales bacterium]
MKTLAINKIPSFFQQLLNRKSLITGHKPFINIADDEKAFEISLAVPGFDKKEIDIRIENDCLIIEGEKRAESTDSNKKWIRREFVYDSFYRSFILPQNADVNRVQAELKNGILNVAIAYKEGELAKKRQIKVH